MSRSFGVAGFGAGMAGRSLAAGYRTAPTLYGPGLPEVRLVAVADANEALAAETARRYGYQRSESSWQAVAAADDIDVVSVVLANPLHREVVEGLLAAGKHVLCEKPLAPTIEDAEAMVAAAAAAAAAGVQAAVGFTFRRSPAIAAVRGLVLSGSIGSPDHPCSASSSDRRGRRRSRTSSDRRGGPATRSTRRARGRGPRRWPATGGT